jgi:ferredoxin-NADP reductase/Na+-transporting NADH:ubiquinone oxidoreductase subunit NqrB
MLKPIDWLLDRITMYRLLMYYLIGLLAAAAGLSALGVLHYSPTAIIFSAALLVVICLISNIVFAYVFEAPANTESAYITALILALIIPPLSSAQGIVFLAAAGGLAIASKYILAIHKKHIFNPAAIAVVLTALAAGQAASWWVGSAPLLPFVLVGGILLVRKIQRWELVLSFLVMAVVSTTFFSLIGGGGIVTNLHQIGLNSALFFLAFVMLTEPMTSPSTTKKQVWYGALAGLLFPPEVHIASLYSTPELVLVVSNVFAYCISPRVKIFPHLRQRLQVGPGTYDFVFQTEQDFSFKPGQYMEWTLPHSQTDSRGSRRYFTLASSPTEPTVRLGVRFYEPGSSFKRAMLKMDSHTPIVATQLGGNFVLPDDEERKLAFIAGGIGITPYRSMVKYLLDTNEQRTMTLLYSAQSAAELAYTDVFSEAEQRLGMKVVYTLTGSEVAADWAGRRGFITAEVIKAEIPDYQERLFYISGTHAMVIAMQDALKQLGVHGSQIKTDFFSGYAA